MNRIIILFELFIVSYSSWGQRYFEFHFPPNITSCSECTGLPNTENFIVKISDTTLYSLAEQDLLLPDSLKQYIIIGFIDSTNGGFNLNWNWHFRTDTNMWLNSGNYEVCDGLPSYVDSNLTTFIFNTSGMFCPSNARIKSEVFPSSIVINVKQSELLEIFPNPIQDKAIIRLNTKNHSGYSLEIFDVLGKIINHMDFSNGNELFILRKSFPVSGIYFYVLIRKDKEVAGRGKIIVN
ncbi:MAG: T9SS type A sorting domain-containing protein [Bacteroidales bacterium]